MIENLDIWFDDELSDMSEPAPLPDSAEKVAGYARRLYQAQLRHKFAMDLYRAEQQKLAANMASILSPIEKAIEWNSAAVEGWHKAAHAAGEVGKTVEFPSGLKSKLTAGQPDWEVTDHEKLMEFIEENAGLPARRAVYPQPQPTLAERFKISEAKKLLQAVKPKGGAEAGEELAVVDMNGVKVDGLRVTAQGNKWKAGS